ncbi:hypothetical protein [Pyxidicoccus sp. MSG2]|uniref:hypothetical protein n=1 Tax=Pyxidicoccus sp. MSG2 TaxID=2996790 RepID=UPI002271E849|nr:hypothetical protein [Pyxidicoccus sp. MSG2]MCY1018101.1 hypothetical protein [Pyxidicoccus sp. MSG2]
MGFLGGIFLAVALNTAPVEQNQSYTKETPEMVAAPVFSPSTCAKKRVDPCGCHHVYGIRHCHPNRKGDHCEAPVKAQLPAESTEAQQTPVKAPVPEQKKQIDPKKSVSM